MKATPMTLNHMGPWREALRQLYCQQTPIDILFGEKCSHVVIVKRGNVAITSIDPNVRTEYCRFHSALMTTNATSKEYMTA